jgi:hypothetical protein
MWAASGAASSSIGWLRLPASLFLSLRPAAAAGADAAAVPHTNCAEEAPALASSGVILEPLVLSEQRTVTYLDRGRSCSGATGTGTQ